MLRQVNAPLDVLRWNCRWLFHLDDVFLSHLSLTTQHRRFPYWHDNQKYWSCAPTVHHLCTYIDIVICFADRPCLSLSISLVDQVRCIWGPHCSTECNPFVHEWVKSSVCRYINWPDVTVFFRSKSYSYIKSEEEDYWNRVAITLLYWKRIEQCDIFIIGIPNKNFANGGWIEVIVRGIHN